MEKRIYKNFIIKVCVLIISLFILFNFIFGFYQIKDLNMMPSFKGNDLLLYYRLNQQYQVNDVVVIKKKNKTSIQRVIACQGDQIEVGNEGIFINNYLSIPTNQQNQLKNIKKRILNKNEYFLVSDDLDQTKPTIEKKVNIKGKIIFLIRTKIF